MGENTKITWNSDHYSRFPWKGCRPISLAELRRPYPEQVAAANRRKARKSKKGDH